MRIFVTTVALLLCGAGIASAQDDRDRKLDELRKEMERSMKSLQEKFDTERERLQKEFKAARERLLEKKEERREERKDEKPRDLEALVHELLKRVDSLEKKLDRQLPKFQDLPHLAPKEFDFKRFQDGVPDEWRRWLEQMPRFRGEEFKKRAPKKDDGDDLPPSDPFPPKKKSERDNSY
jgi:hypothetical protein